MRGIGIWALVALSHGLMFYDGFVSFLGFFAATFTFGFIVHN